MYVKRLVGNILLAVVVVLATSFPVSAMDVPFYASNDILYYNDKAVACSSVSSVSSGGSINSSEDMNKRAEEILKYLTGRGLTLAQASGFVGNMKQESQLNPALIQGMKTADNNYTPVDGVGFGLVQWTFTSRQGPLVDLSKSTNRSIIDMGLQLDYVWQEVTGYYKSTIQALAADSSITPTDAAIIVHGKTQKTKNDSRFASAPELAYEGSNDTADEVVNVRGGNAEFYYNMFKGKIADGTGVDGGTSTTTGPSTATSGTCGGTREPTEGCPVTAPIYGVGGNGKQLKQADLEKIYGVGGTSGESNQVSVDFLGKSLQVHKLVQPCLQSVIDEIKSKNINYTINEIGGWRTEAGAGAVSAADSYHYYGAAIDINPATNGYYSTPGSYPYDMPSEYIEIFKSHGFSWGGDWTSAKDYMHFEFNGLEP